MGTLNSASQIRMPSSRRFGRFELSVRALLFLIGLIGVFWSASWPQFWLASSTRDVTARLLAADRFKLEDLIGVLITTQRSSSSMLARYDVARLQALIRLRIAKDSGVRSSTEELERRATSALQALSSSLSSNPADSFLWLMLYSTELTRSGFDRGLLQWLEESYALGPLEGWIALQRNAVGLAAFDNLKASVQAQVVSEFASLVDGSFLDVAIVNLTTVGWAHRERLLASLIQLDAISREAFAKKLSREGLKIVVPGVEVDDRVWH